MWDDVNKAREREDETEYCTSTHPYTAGIKCSRWLLACRCVDAYLRSRFAALIISLPALRLVLNWAAEWTQFVDEDYLKLKLKLRWIYTTAEGNLCFHLPRYDPCVLI